MNCPSCGQALIVPASSPQAPFVPKLEVKLKPSVPTNYKVPSGVGGFGKFLVTFLLLTLAAFAFACYRFHESPRQAWQRLANYAETQVQPAPIAKPTPVALSAPKPVAMQPPETLPVKKTNIETAPVPPPPPDPLTWILDHKDRSPQEITLRSDTKFPIIYNGQVAGSGNVPAGSEVKLVRIDLKNQQATVACESYGNGTVTLPIQSTDLVDRAKAAMVKAEADKKAAEAAKLAADAAPAVAPPKPEAADAAPAVAPPKPEAADVPATTSKAPPAQDNGFGNSVAASGTTTSNAAFVHPGLLHNDDDFRRMKENLEREPWQSGWQRLIANRHASLDWKPHPIVVVVRGKNPTLPQNYAGLFNDVAAAYACALRWRISGDTKYADKSVEIMNAWSSTLTKITGSTDADLAAGIYGL